MKKKDMSYERLQSVSDILTNLEIENIRIFAHDLVINVGGRIFTVGNGGSSAIASHFASDLLNLKLKARCLTDNVPRLTAITNDYGWGVVYSKLLDDLKANYHDSLVIFSVNCSSGKSPAGAEWSKNLGDVARTARKYKIPVYLIGGNEGGGLKEMAWKSITFPGTDPYVIEGVMSVVAHLVIGCIKEELK